MRSSLISTLFASVCLAPVVGQDAPSATVRSYELQGLLDPVPSDQPTQRLGLKDFDPVGERGYGNILNLDAHESGGITAELLIDFLDLQLGEGSNEGVEFEVDEDRLLVTAPRGLQAQVADLLDALRAWQSRQATLVLSVHHAPTLQRPALGTVTAATQGALRAWPEVYRLRLSLKPGQRVAQSQLRRETYLSDFELDPTGVTPVLNPVIAELLQGCTTVVRSTFLGRGELLLDCQLEVCEAVGRARSIKTSTGDLQLPQLTHLRLGSSVATRVGQTQVLGYAHCPAAGPRANGTLILVAHVEPPAHKARYTPPGEIAIRSYSLGAVLAPHDFSFGPSSTALPFTPAHEYEPHVSGGFSFGCERGGADTMRVWVEGEVSPDLSLPRTDLDVGEDLVVLMHDPATHAKASWALRTRVARPMLSYQLVAAVTSESPAGGHLDAKQFERLAGAQSLAHVATRGLSGQRVQLDLRLEQAYLYSLVRSSGGLGQTLDAADDPIVQTLVSGVKLEVRGRLDQDTVHLETVAYHRGQAEFTTHATSLGALMTVGPQRQVVASHALHLARGDAVVLADEPNADGTRLVLALQAR